MGLLEGKKGIVFGIANEKSYATFISKHLKEEGAQLLFTHLPGDKMENRVRRALKDEETGIMIDDPWLVPCDVSNDADLDAVFAKIKQDFGSIDFIVHAVAFAQREFLEVGKFHTTTREAWNQALEISAYSLLAMGQRAVDVMPEGGSIISMTYLGGERVVPGYNIMGIAKAALEHTTRYLAFELGRKNIRVNTISGGPLRTLAISAVGDSRKMFDLMEQKSSLGRNIEGGEVGQTAAFLVSDYASGITGETVHVDAGYSYVGM